MRALIAGGGTGGHIVPALAIADALRRSSSAEIRFVGTSRGLETRLVPQAGYPLDLVTVGQLNQVGWATKVKTLSALPLAIADCVRLVGRFRPDVVIGVGGYASGPAMLAAVLRRVPTLAFEPNAVPGMANRLIGRWVTMAAVNFAAASGYFRKAEVTGIPVRAAFFNLQPKPAESAPHLLVFGGSQGARILNQRMPEIAAALLEAVPELTILHQSGAKHFERTLAAYQTSGAPQDRWRVAAYLDDMPKQFEEADLVLSRSGAATVAELAAAGKPSLLVPFPRAADDHQRRNAEALGAAGAARVVIEAEMTSASLLRELSSLLVNRKELHAMGARARTLAYPDATAKIAALAVSLAGRGRLPQPQQP